MRLNFCFIKNCWVEDLHTQKFFVSQGIIISYTSRILYSFHLFLIKISIKVTVDTVLELIN